MMRNERQHENLFGRADAGFEARVHNTLARMKRSEEEKNVKKFSIGLAVALAVVLLGTIAFAASRLGIWDFLGRYETNVDPRKMEEIITTDAMQTVGETSLATFRLREAAYDGELLYAAVEVIPKQDDILILGAMIEESDAMSSLGSAYAQDTRTIREWAQENAKTRIIDAGVGEKAYDEGMEPGYIITDWGMDILLEADGTTLFVFHAGIEGHSGDVLEMAVSCYTREEQEEVERGELRFQAWKAGQEFSGRSTQSALYTDCGVRVDEVHLQGTPMDTHMRVYYTVVDEAAYAKTEDGLWFEVIDQSGERLIGGASVTGSVEELEAENGQRRFVQMDGIGVFDALPQYLTLRGYNAWEKNRYEAHEIAFE